MVIRRPSPFHPPLKKGEVERGGRAIFLAVLAREGSLLYCNHRYLFSATDGYHGLLRPSSRRSRNYTHTNGRTAHGTQQTTYRHAGQSVRGSSRRGSTCETAKIMSIVARLDNEDLVLRFGRSETAERALVRAQLPQQRAPSPASTCEARAWPLSVVDVWAGITPALGDERADEAARVRHGSGGGGQRG